MHLHRSGSTIACVDWLYGTHGGKVGGSGISGNIGITGTVYCYAIAYIISGSTEIGRVYKGQDLGSICN